ncbi:MAG: malate dehydrogenase [Leptospiraceae bacterium]|nr:malate dehydrogenase [Leptospiraceae bacterium]
MPLEYHKSFPSGKIAIQPTKPTRNFYDLSLAYSPGVAEPCLEIYKDSNLAYDYTNKGNLVAVISNGTAVLGLGNLGALASKPVMEGKAVLFKKFAGIDVFDIEINTTDSQKFIETVALLEPTFGGINLEDIKAPECFEIETELIRRMSIPVFHDDQHGTAVVSVAALLNYFEITGKNPPNCKVVISGAGASAISIGKFIQEIGISSGNIFMADSKGILNHNRKDLNSYKQEFVKKTHYETIEDAIKEADIFIGVSVKGILNENMVASMAKDPCILALANPDPEIPYPVAKAVRKDLIMGTGRSDYPNQVNNTLAFPFIFRGALDVRAQRINNEMKLACAKTLASLARKKTPEFVSEMYEGQEFVFGPEYILPKPFDPRIYYEASVAVAEAAVSSQIAQKKYMGREAYLEYLKKRIEFK